MPEDHPINIDLSFDLQSRLSHTPTILEALKEGTLPEKILEFSPEIMIELYKAAAKFYQDKKYAEAADAFFFLVTISPYQYDYWIGFGAATERCGDFDTAIDAFEMAAICCLECPTAYFHLAQCFFAMHDRANASKAIDLCLEYSENNTMYEDLHRQALAAKETIYKEE